MSFLTQKWQIYLGGKMSGLSFEKMNNWRQIAKEKLISAAQKWILCIYNQSS